MADFHVTLTGTADDAVVDDFIMKKAKKLVKDLQAGNVNLDFAFVNSGHFLGGSKSLLEEEPQPQVVEEPIEQVEEN
jgi:hypothetical protein